MSDPEMIRLKNPVSDQDLVSGAAIAPVTLLEYGNFECIDCGRAHTVVKELQKLIGEDLRLVFRHFLGKTHPHARRAAEAAEAAHAQGKLWKMVDQLFTHQQALEDRDLSRYAGRIGLDLKRFEEDLTGNVFREHVEAAYQRALFDEHITGTPTFYINDVRYTGAVDQESIVNAIKQADSEGRVQWPETSGRMRRILDRLHRRANN